MSFHKSLVLSLSLAFCPVGFAQANPNDTSQQMEVETDTETQCIQRGQWVAPKNMSAQDNQSLMQHAAQQPIVLLGERHTDASHHRWQLQTVTQLFAHNSNMVIGFEMFPRRIQPVLDAWVRGELSEREFLDKSDWDEVWRYDADLYMPLFRFARMNRLPIIALNVDRELIGAVSQKGWDNVPPQKKEGMQNPRKALPAYEASLKEVFNMHSHMGKNEKQDDEKTNTRFRRFVESQLTWDGAMAQALAKVRRMGGEPLVVGIMGSGHMVNRFGVPHQLEGLGLKSTVLVPWTIGQDCAEITPNYADAIFGVEEMADDQPKEKAMLGVRIGKNEHENGVLVDQVVEESVAEDAGLEEGDMITMAAGIPLKDPSDLIEVVQRQPPGTWLPLTVLRNSESIELIAKFPQSAE